MNTNQKLVNDIENVLYKKIYKNFWGENTDKYINEFDSLISNPNFDNGTPEGDSLLNQADTMSDYLLSIAEYDIFDYGIEEDMNKWWGSLSHSDRKSYANNY